MYTHEGHNLRFLKLASQALTVEQPIPKSQIMTFESITTPPLPPLFTMSFAFFLNLCAMPLSNNEQKYLSARKKVRNVRNKCRL